MRLVWLYSNGGKSVIVGDSVSCKTLLPLLETRASAADQSSARGKFAEECCAIR